MGYTWKYLLVRSEITYVLFKINNKCLIFFYLVTNYLPLNDIKKPHAHKLRIYENHRKKCSGVSVSYVIEPNMSSGITCVYSKLN